MAQDSSRVVYRARDRQSGGIVAIRRLLPTGRGGEGYDERQAEEFTAAVQALAGVECPGLRHPVAWGLDPVDRLPFVASEWVDGETLAKQLDGGSLSVKTGWFLAESALAAQIAVDTTGQGWQIDTSVESVVVADSEESFQFSFWVSPFPGASASIEMVRNLIPLIELAMGWQGRMPTASAGDGLAGWIRMVRQHKMDASDARHVLSETRQQADDAHPASGAVPSGKLAEMPPVVRGGLQPRRSSSRAWVAAVFILGFVALGGGWWLWRQAHPDRTALVNTSPDRKGARGDAAASAPGHHPILAEQPTLAEQVNARAAKLAKMAAQGNLEDAVDDRVFGPSDGTLLHNFIGREVAFKGVLRSVDDSGSGKTRYLEFSDDRGVNDFCGYLKTKGAAAGLSKPALKSLIGRKIVIRGDVKSVPGTKRVGIHIVNRKQITEPLPGQ